MDSASAGDNRTQNHVSVLYRGVVALQENRTREGIIGIDASAGATFQRGVVDDACSIQLHRDVSIHQQETIAIPLPARAGGVFRRPDAPEHGAGALDSLHAAVTRTAHRDKAANNPGFCIEHNSFKGHRNAVMTVSPPGRLTQKSLGRYSSAA